jgi:hypothetical protein
MKIEFIAALGNQNPAYANEPLSGAFCALPFSKNSLGEQHVRPLASTGQ